MPDLKYLAYKTGFELLWAGQIAKLVRAFSKCRGVIYTLHRVLPDLPADFSPNAILQVTPQYLEYFIIRLRELGVEFITLDEAINRIEASEFSGKFAVLTFDDAYRDNLLHALPVLRRRKCPFTLYVPTAFVDGLGQLWWQALEDIIAQQDAVAIPEIVGNIEYESTKSNGQKLNIYKMLYMRMRAMTEQKRTDFMVEFSTKYGLDLEAHCRELIMTWQELQTFADEPLCTIGAHTVHHYQLAKLDPDLARHEIEQSISIIKSQFGDSPRHFSYPYGNLTAAGPREYEIVSDLGLSSAVTTRPGGLYAHHQDKLSSLPRISLNGLFQEHRYVDVLATGALFSRLEPFMF